MKASGGLTPTNRISRVAGSYTTAPFSATMRENSSGSGSNASTSSRIRPVAITSLRPEVLMRWSADHVSLAITP